MATHAIGPGTRNLSVNVPNTEAAAMGRAAWLLELSLGEYCRRLWAAGARWLVAVRVIVVARREDAHAARLLTMVLADGRIDAAEVPQVRAARALVERAAGRLHEITPDQAVEISPAGRAECQRATRDQREVIAPPQRSAPRPAFQSSAEGHR